MANSSYWPSSIKRALSDADLVVSENDFSNNNASLWGGYKSGGGRTLNGPADVAQSFCGKIWPNAKTSLETAVRRMEHISSIVGNLVLSYEGSTNSNLACQLQQIFSSIQQVEADGKALKDGVKASPNLIEELSLRKIAEFCLGAKDDAVLADFLAQWVGAAKQHISAVRKRVVLERESERNRRGSSSENYLQKWDGDKWVHEITVRWLRDNYSQNTDIYDVRKGEWWKHQWGVVRDRYQEKLVATINNAPAVTIHSLGDRVNYITHPFTKSWLDKIYSLPVLASPEDESILKYFNALYIGQCCVKALAPAWKEEKARTDEIVAYTAAHEKLANSLKLLSDIGSYLSLLNTRKLSARFATSYHRDTASAQRYSEASQGRYGSGSL